MAGLTIGERIRVLRKPTFTQHDLAAAADVSVDVIRKLEQGRRHTASIATLARIARVLGVDLADLLGSSRPTCTTDEDQGPVGAIGHTQAAESVLLTMERAAPEWTLQHRLPRLLVGELLVRNRPSARLRELARRLNVARASRPS